MSYEQQCQQLDEKIKSIQNIPPFDHYTLDGIANIDQWRKQAIRPLFIGKEAHGDAYGKKVWDMRDWLNVNPREDVCAATPSTWPRAAYISFGLQNGMMEYDDIPHLDNDIRVAEALRTVAFINVGKYTAESNTPWRRLNALYQQNRLALHDQISFIQPNVIIGWSTLGYFKTDTEFMSRFASNSSQDTDYGSETNCPVTSWYAGGKLFIEAYHPASRTSPKEYVDNIIDAVKANIQHIDQSTPTV
jgi:hypothetical protein